MSDKLINHREIWKEKKILRDIYISWYRQVLKDLSGGGRTIELGAGGGNFKEFKPDVIASDIERCPWLDTCFDAHDLPFKGSSVGNIVMIDVLHHLADPVGFFREASRVLEKGGRIVLIEPYPTPFSLFVYRRFHPEPFNMETDFFKPRTPSTAVPPVPSVANDSMANNQKKDPWEANQAAAYLLFFKHKKTFLEHFGQEFKIVKRKKMSCLLYPASGGFENKAMIPGFLVPVFKFLEILLTPLRWLLAFRCYVVLEKK